MPTVIVFSTQTSGDGLFPRYHPSQVWILLYSENSLNRPNSVGMAG